MSDQPEDELPTRQTPDVEEALADAVKTAIVDRILAELRQNILHAAPRSSYTKSDSGVYGKYEKADIPSESVLDLIEQTLRQMVDEPGLNGNPGEAPPEDRPA